MTEELYELEKRTLTEYYDRLLRATRHLKYLHLKFLWHYIHHSEQFSQLGSY